MIIKDNFLTAEQLTKVNEMIDADIKQNDGRFERYDDEMDHHETDDCNLFYLNKEIKDFFFGLLVCLKSRIAGLSCHKATQSAVPP